MKSIQPTPTNSIKCIKLTINISKNKRNNSKKQNKPQKENKMLAGSDSRKVLNF